MQDILDSLENLKQVSDEINFVNEISQIYRKNKEINISGFENGFYFLFQWDYQLLKHWGLNNIVNSKELDKNILDYFKVECITDLESTQDLEYLNLKIQFLNHIELTEEQKETIKYQFLNRIKQNLSFSLRYFEQYLIDNKFQYSLDLLNIIQIEGDEQDILFLLNLMLKLIIQQNETFILGTIFQHVLKLETEYEMFFDNLKQYFINNNKMLIHFIDMLLDAIYDTIQSRTDNDLQTIEIYFMLLIKLGLISRKQDEVIDKKIFNILILIGDHGYHTLLLQQSKLMNGYCSLLIKYAKYKNNNLLAHLNLMFNSNPCFIHLIFRLHLRFPKFYSELYSKCNINVLKNKSYEYVKDIVDKTDRIANGLKIKVEENKQTEVNKLELEYKFKLKVEDKIDNNIYIISNSDEFEMLFENYTLRLKYKLLPYQVTKKHNLCFISDRNAYSFLKDNHIIILFKFDENYIVVKSSEFVNPFLLWNLIF